MQITMEAKSESIELARRYQGMGCSPALAKGLKQDGMMMMILMMMKGMAKMITGMRKMNMKK